MEKVKNNKLLIVITSIMTLIPLFVGLILWNELPDRMATHFGANNVPNGWSSKTFTVFGIPLILLAAHLMCAIATALDPKRIKNSNKIYAIILFICPLVAIFLSVVVYGYALKYDINVGFITMMFLAIEFIVIGNYLPKCRQNYTVGIKIPWTLNDEDNWNYTHRFAGWLWMVAGVAMIIVMLLKLPEWIIIVIFAIMVIVPIIYSGIYHFTHKKQGD